MRSTIFSTSILTLTTLFAQPIVASFIPSLFHSFEGRQNACANPCGYYGQLCCASGQQCYTDSNGQAQCGGTSNAQTQNGQWQYYTTTYVQTDLQTVVTTFSSFVAVTTAAVATMSCSYSQGETPCGSVCCLSGQYCQSSGSCVAVPGGSSGYYSSLYTVTTIITNTASAAIRPTTQTVLTLTSTGVATATTAFQTPVGTDGAILTGPTSGSSGGLSGGAIAGIVIGVIAAIIILILICACCCFKGLIDGLLGIFGLGSRRRTTTTEEVFEERHSRRGGTARRWFGQPGRTEVIEEKKKKTSGGFERFAGVAAVLGGLAIALGLKRRNDRRKDDKSDVGYGSSAYYYSDYTSSSSPSSVTRTRSRSRSRR